MNWPRYILGLKMSPFFSWRGAKKWGTPMAPALYTLCQPFTSKMHTTPHTHPQCTQTYTPTPTTHTSPHTHKCRPHKKHTILTPAHNTHINKTHKHKHIHTQTHTHTHTHHFTIVIPISLWRLIIIGSLMILTLWDTLKLLNYNIHIWREWSTENIQAPCSWELNTKPIPKVQKTATCLEKPQPNYTDSHRSGQSS